MHYMDKPLEIFVKVAKERYLVGYRRALEELPPEEYRELVSTIRGIKALATRVAEDVKDIEIDRNTDYTVLTKNAKKRFADADIAMLEKLVASDGGFHIEYLADIAGIKYPEARRRLRRLARLGLTESFKGGWTEDGEIFGSGYGLAERNRSEAQAIVSSYLGATNQETLIKDDFYD